MSALISNFESEELKLFKKCDTAEVAYYIDPASTSVTGWQEKFRLMGKIIGKALFERIPLNLCFAFPLYKVILERNINFHDVRYLDTSVNCYYYIDI